MSEKKYIFGSKEWFDAFVQVLNSDKEYNNAARNWEDPITLVVTELPETVKNYFNAEKIVVRLDLYHGQCRGYEFLKEPDEKPSPITLTGSYATMKKIALGQLGPTTAIMTGQLKAKGNVFKLISNAGASAAFVNALKKVPTEFLA
jgi:putative sterol carrier protein